jgi:hypothetical protein
MSHIDVALNKILAVLVPLLACSLLIFLSFDIVMVARQLCLWVSYSVPVACFSGQGLLDILITTNNFIATSNTYRIKKPWDVWSRSSRHYDSLKCKELLTINKANIPDDLRNQQHCCKYHRPCKFKFYDQDSPQSFLCSWHQNIVPALTQPYKCDECKCLILELH